VEAGVLTAGRHAPTQSGDPPGEYKKGDEVDIDEIIKRLYRRFIWLDEKCDIFDGEVDKQLKIVAQINSTAANLVKFLEKKGVIASEGEEGLLDALSKIPEKVVKIFRRGE
jgi:hypothetical protein